MKNATLFKLLFETIGELKLATKESIQDLQAKVEVINAQAEKVKAEVQALKEADSAKMAEIATLKQLNADMQASVDLLNQQLAQSGLADTSSFAAELAALTTAFEQTQASLQAIDDINPDAVPLDASNGMPAVDAPVMDVQPDLGATTPVEAIPVDPVTMDTVVTDPADVSIAVDASI
jgi:septation ring formation regulator EzrA